MEKPGFCAGIILIRPSANFSPEFEAEENLGDLENGVEVMLSSVYVVYLLGSCILTVWVARTISVAGRPFLVQVFQRNQELADAINQLLIVGFYLLNAGLVGITLHEHVDVNDLKTGIELVSCKIGRTILILGIWHFCNLIILCLLRDHKISFGRRQTTISK